MCFSIPAKVEKIIGNTVVIEGGKKVKVHTLDKVIVGDYLRLTGGIITDKMTANQALTIRRLIKRLNNYG